MVFLKRLWLLVKSFGPAEWFFITLPMLTTILYTINTLQQIIGVNFGPSVGGVYRWLVCAALISFMEMCLFIIAIFCILMLGVLEVIGYHLREWYYEKRRILFPTPSDSNFYTKYDKLEDELYQHDATNVENEAPNE